MGFVVVGVDGCLEAEEEGATVAVEGLGVGKVGEIGVTFGFTGRSSSYEGVGGVLLVTGGVVVLIIVGVVVV